MKLFGEVLLASEIISLAMVCVTMLAVIVALAQPFIRDQIDRRKAKKSEREEEIAVLIALYEHFLICCERIKHFVKGIPPQETVSSFRLEIAKSVPLRTVAVEKVFEIVAYHLRDDPEMLRNILKTSEDHIHINEIWNYIEKVKATRPIRITDSHEVQEISRKIRSLLSSIEGITHHYHQATRDCLSQLKERIGNIAPEIELEDPEELPPINEIDTDSSSPDA